MTGAEASLYLAFIQLIIKHGIPTAIKLYETWNKQMGNNLPTEADFEKLRKMVPHPSTYKKGVKP